MPSKPKAIIMPRTKADVSRAMKPSQSPITLPDPEPGSSLSPPTYEAMEDLRAKITEKQAELANAQALVATLQSRLERARGALAKFGIGL